MDLINNSLRFFFSLSVFVSSETTRSVQGIVGGIATGETSNSKFGKAAQRFENRHPRRYEFDRERKTDAGVAVVGAGHTGETEGSLSGKRQLQKM